MINFTTHEKIVKAIIRKSTDVDPFFTAKYSFSPYRGCSHGCIYCDGRAEKYYVEGDFERDITIRANLPEILRNEIGRIKEKGIFVIGSGVSDPYQQVEERYRLTRTALEVLESAGQSVIIATKSALVERDIDILSRMAKTATVIVIFSITTDKNGITAVTEPGASPVSERIRLLKTFKDAGCFTGVLAMPFLPGITDELSEIHHLIEVLSGTGTDFIMPGLLTLRPGCQKQFYFNRIMDSTYVDTLKSCTDIYRGEWISGSPDFGYSAPIYNYTTDILNKFNIPSVIPHSIFRMYTPVYDEILILMRQMKDLFHRKNLDITPLNRSLKLFAEYIHSQKKLISRRRSPELYKQLEAELIDLIKENRLHDIINNEKLSDFMRKVVIDKMTFNPVTLRLDQ